MEIAIATEMKPFYIICRNLTILASAQGLSESRDFELKGYCFDALPESSRVAQVTRIGIIQNKIVASTSASVKEQVRIHTLSIECFPDFCSDICCLLAEGCTVRATRVDDRGSWRESSQRFVSARSLE